MQRYSGIARGITLVLIPLLIIIMIGAGAVLAEGLGATISASSGTVDIGSTVTVTVSSSRAIPATNYEIDVSFDTNLFTYTGYKDLTGAQMAGANDLGGKIKMLTTGGTATTASLGQLTFRANAAGTAKFTITFAEILTETPPTGNSVSVTTRPPLPGNTNLKSLSVDQGTLNPAFSAGTQSYSLPVAMGVDSIVVKAEPEDAKAKVSVSGNTGLQDGSNTIRIVVTAQNGSTKTYTITANRQGPTPTPEPTPTPPVSLTIDGSRFSVVQPPEGMPVPAGFYESTLDIGGQPVTAFKSIQGDLVLLYLSNEGPESGFYFYDSETGDLHDYAVIRLPAASYTRLKPGPDIEIPTGFVQASLTIDGELFECWRPLPELDPSPEVEGSDIYLLYLMDERGDKGFFLYQVSTRRIFPYQMIPRAPEPTPLPSPVPEPEPEPTPEEVTRAPGDPYVIATIVLAALCVVFLGLMVWAFLRKGGGGNGGNDNPDDFGGPGSGGFDANAPADRHKDTLPRPPRIRRVD